MARERQYHLRLDEDEDARFKRVAAHHELEVAQMLRRVVREEEERLGIEPKKKGKKS